MWFELGFELSPFFNDIFHILWRHEKSYDLLVSEIALDTIS